MADHFEEVVNLRISTIEQRLDSEIKSVQEALSKGIGAIFLDAGRVKGRLDQLEERMDRLETKFDSYLERTLDALADIARRLPPTA